MKKENISNFYEREPDIVSIPPLVESFSDTSQAALFWPEKMTNDESFCAQIQERQKVREAFDRIRRDMPRPDVSIDLALENGDITEEALIRTYETLSRFLESDPLHARITLYIPFELLPSVDHKYDEGLLCTSAKRFQTAYMNAWFTLLSTHDVRSNFVDGDATESEYRNQSFPRVVKAAHLLPVLVEKGYVDRGDVFDLLTSEDPILRSSVADTLPVLRDIGFLSESDVERMSESESVFVRNIARLLSLPDRSRSEIEEKETISYKSIQDSIQEAFSRIDAEEIPDANEKRIRWLRDVQKRKAIQKIGQTIARALIQEGVSDGVIGEFSSRNAGSPERQALVEGVCGALEGLSVSDTNRARGVYARFSGRMSEFFRSGDTSLRESVSVALRRLSRLGIVGDEQLSELGIENPDLSRPFSRNLESMDTELAEVRNLVSRVESDPYLAKRLFPVLLVFGSRLKGYGALDSDTDLGIFIRSDVPDVSRVELREHVRSSLKREKTHGDMVEFWLDQAGEELRIRDFSGDDLLVGKQHWSHILFGAAWEGREDVMADLRWKLLVPYMRDTRATIYGRDARSLYLEELERDTLQFRLMHKGYERFYPSFGGMDAEHAGDIDGDSVFWDSGYRWLATKLFLDRVFLPRFSSPNSLLHGK